MGGQRQILEERIRYLEQKLDYVYRELETEKKRVSILEQKINRGEEAELSAQKEVSEAVRELHVRDAVTEEPVYATKESYDARDASYVNYSVNYAVAGEHPPKKDSDMEYKIGSSVFGFIGVLFLLVAFVTFGVYQMDSVGQGILLYAMSIIVICISNFWFIKKNHRFGIVILSLGFAGLYASTIVNYLFLHNLSALSAVMVTLFLAVVTMLYGHQREEASLQVTSIWGCYISLLPLERLEGTSDLLIPFMVAGIATMLGCYLNYRKENRAVTLCTLYGFGLFSCYLHCYGMISGLSDKLLLVTGIAAVLISGAVYFTTRADSMCFANYCIVSGVQLFAAMAAAILGAPYDESPVILFAVLAFGIFFFFTRRNEGKWAVYIEGVVMLQWLAFCTQDADFFLVQFALILILSKILACRDRVVNFDSILTWFGVFLCAAAYDYLTVIPIIAVIIISPFFLHRRKTFYVAAVFAAVFWVMNLHICRRGLEAGELIVINQAVLALLTFAAARIRRLRDAFTDMFVYGLLIIQAMILLPLISLQADFLLPLLSCFTGGLSICFIQPEEVMSRQMKRFILMLFLSVMVFAFPIDTPVIVSMLLMLLSITGIGIGFYCREKPIRVYSLALSLLICAKTMLYDFYSAELNAKIAAFFVVGVLILVISFVYFKLESSSREDGA